MLEKRKLAILITQPVPLFSQDLEVPTHPAVAAAREVVLAADAIWIFSPVYNFSIPGTVKNLLDWLSRALDLSDTRGASALQDKFITVSSVANAGHDQLFAIYKDLLPFIRTQVVGDFTAARVNDSAWADGKLVLEEATASSLAKQADDLLAAQSTNPAKRPARSELVLCLFCTKTSSKSLDKSGGR